MARVAQHMLDVERTLTLEHECPKCGHATRAIVRAVGQGTQYGGSSHGPTAQQRALLEMEAQGTLEPDARESLGMVPCPKCGRRNVGTIVWVCLRALLFTGLCGIVIGLFSIAGLDALGVFGSRWEHPGAGAYLAWGVPITLVATLALEAGFVGARFVRAKKAVRFVAPDAP